MLARKLTVPAAKSLLKDWARAGGGSASNYNSAVPMFKLSSGLQPALVYTCQQKCMMINKGYRTNEQEHDYSAYLAATIPLSSPRRCVCIRNFVQCIVCWKGLCREIVQDPGAMSVYVSLFLKVNLDFLVLL